MSNADPTAPESVDEEVKVKARKKRIDWEENHALILDAIEELRPVLKRFPMLAEIEEKTRLSFATIERHIATLKAEPDRFAKYRLLTDKVIMSMYDGAVDNKDAKCQKLFMQVTEGWVEEKKVNQVNVNPYAGQTDDDLRKKLAERLAKMKPKESPGDPPAA